MSQILRQSTQIKVVIGPVVAVGDGFTPVTTLSLASADEAEILKSDAASVTDISGATFAAITGADGYYNLTLTTSHTDTCGLLTVLVNDDSLCLPVRATFQVVEEAVYDAFYAASAPGYVANAPVNVAQFGGSNGTFSSGRPEVNTSHWGGTAVGSTEVRANLINVAGSAVSASAGLLNANVTQISGDGPAADNLEAAADGTGYNLGGGSVVAASVTGAVGSVTGNVGGNVTGSVGSVTGNVGGNVTGSVGSVASGGITAASFAADAITGDKIAPGALAKGDQVTGFNDLSAAQVNAEVDTALADVHLDHLIASADPGGVVANSSFLAKLVSKSVTPAFADYDNTTDSLQALRDRGDAAWTTATGFSTHSAADVWAVGTRTLTAGTNIDGSTFTAIPWNASWDAEVQSEVQDAIEANHLDHLLAATYDPASKPGAADALLNELVESDGGVARFTANALEQAPSGSLTAADVADAVWDEALSGHLSAGSTGEALNAAGSAGDPWTTTLPGSYTGSQAGKMLSDILTDTGTTLQAELDGIQADTEDIQSRLPAALVGGRIDANAGSWAGTATVKSSVSERPIVAVQKLVGDDLDDEMALITNSEPYWTVGYVTGQTTNIDADVLLGISSFDFTSGLAPVWQGAAGTGSTTTAVVLGGTASTTDDIYNDQWIEALFASGRRELRRITDYVGSTRTATVSQALSGAPVNGSTSLVITVRPNDPDLSTLDAADVRVAVGLASANLDTQLSNIQTDTNAIEVDTQDIQSRLPAALVSGRMDSNVGAVGGNTTAPTNMITVYATDFAANYDTSFDGWKVVLNADQTWASFYSVNSTGQILKDLDASVGSSGVVVNSFTTGAKAELQTEAEDALVTHRLDELLNADSDIDGAAPPTVGSVFHELMSKSTGSFTFDQTTDSLEAVRDRTEDVYNLTANLGVSSITDAVEVIQAGLVLGVGTVSGSTSTTVTLAAMSTPHPLLDGLVGATVVVSADGESGGRRGQPRTVTAVSGNILFGTAQLTVDRAWDADPQSGDEVTLLPEGVYAPSVRSAVGLASANLDTQLAALDTLLDSILADTGTDGVAVSAATANQIADALLDRAAGVETNRTPRQALRLILAALVGKLSGAATTTVTVRDTNDGVNRIVATVDADGNRSAVTLDAS